RTYRSGDTNIGPFGPGTMMGYEEFLQQTSSTVLTLRVSRQRSDGVRAAGGRDVREHDGAGVSGGEDHAERRRDADAAVQDRRERDLRGAGVRGAAAERGHRRQRQPADAGPRVALRGDEYYRRHGAAADGVARHSFVGLVTPDKEQAGKWF